MTSFKSVSFAIAIPVLALTVLAAASGGKKQEVELDDSEVFIEFNSTDGDFGIQFFWDGEPWKRMKVENPDGKKVLDVNVKRNLRQQGLTEGFFESAEPPTSVLNMQQFLARFPAGEYEFEGTTLDGDELEGETDFTHILPAAPANLMPVDGASVDASLPLVVSFGAVTQDLSGSALVPELYEVNVETENGILKKFTITLDGDAAAPSVTVPPEFLSPGTDYKFEVIVQEESGNRTISEIEFSTL